MIYSTVNIWGNTHSSPITHMCPVGPISSSIDSVSPCLPPLSFLFFLVSSVLCTSSQILLVCTHFYSLTMLLYILHIGDIIFASFLPLICSNNLCVKYFRFCFCYLSFEPLWWCLDLILHFILWVTSRGGCYGFIKVAGDWYKISSVPRNHFTPIPPLWNHELKT